MISAPASGHPGGRTLASRHLEPTYTHTVWRVKPGHEEEFVRRWIAFAEAGGAHGLAAAAKLLRDHDEPTRFVSFGPWRSFEAASEWRSSAAFAERLRELQEVVETFEPSTLEQVTER